MAYTSTPARFHATVVREGNGTHTIVSDDLTRRGHVVQVRGFASREDALIVRDDLRRAVAAGGTFVHTTGCCA